VLVVETAADKALPPSFLPYMFQKGEEESPSEKQERSRWITGGYNEISGT